MYDVAYLSFPLGFFDEGTLYTCIPTKRDVVVVISTQPDFVSAAVYGRFHVDQACGRGMDCQIRRRVVYRTKAVRMATRSSHEARSHGKRLVSLLWTRPRLPLYVQGGGERSSSGDDGQSCSS